MLKVIRIKNFESHEDTEIVFDSGFNVVVGDSDGGKSSLIRALDLVSTNNFNRKSIRVGCKFCIVYLETDKGWVECRRGTSVNEWSCLVFGEEVKEYKAVGVGVPSEVPLILGLGEKELCGLKEKPNFMFQLDKHYMLAEIDGKKATSNMVARLMDNAIGLGGMEDLIKHLATDMGKERRRQKDIEGQINSVKEKVGDIATYKATCALFDECEQLYSETERNKDSYSRGIVLFNEYKDLVDSEKTISKQLGKLSKIDKLPTLCDDILSFYELFDEYKACLVFLEQNPLQNIDFTPLEQQLNDLFDLLNTTFEIEGLFQEYRNLNLLQIGATNSLSAVDEEIVDAEKSFEDFKKTISFCPFCDKEF